MKNEQLFSKINPKENEIFFLDEGLEIEKSISFLQSECGTLNFNNLRQSGKINNAKKKMDEEEKKPSKIFNTENMDTLLLSPDKTALRSRNLSSVSNIGILLEKHVKKSDTIISPNSNLMSLSKKRYFGVSDFYGTNKDKSKLFNDAYDVKEIKNLLKRESLIQLSNKPSQNFFQTLDDKDLNLINESSISLISYGYGNTNHLNPGNQINQFALNYSDDSIFYCTNTMKNEMMDYDVVSEYKNKSELTDYEEKYEYYNYNSITYQKKLSENKSKNKMYSSNKLKLLNSGSLANIINIDEMESYRLSVKEKKYDIKNLNSNELTTNEKFNLNSYKKSFENLNLLKSAPFYNLNPTLSLNSNNGNNNFMKENLFADIKIIDNYDEKIGLYKLEIEQTSSKSNSTNPLGNLSIKPSEKNSSQNITSPDQNLISSNNQIIKPENNNLPNHNINGNYNTNYGIIGNLIFNPYSSTGSVNNPASSNLYSNFKNEVPKKEKKKLHKIIETSKEEKSMIQSQNFLIKGSQIVNLKAKSLAAELTENKGENKIKNYEKEILVNLRNKKVEIIKENNEENKNESNKNLIAISPKLQSPQKKNKSPVNFIHSPTGRGNQIQQDYLKNASPYTKAYINSIMNIDSNLNLNKNQITAINNEYNKNISANNTNYLNEQLANNCNTNLKKEEILDNILVNNNNYQLTFISDPKNNSNNRFSISDAISFCKDNKDKKIEINTDIVGLSSNIEEKTTNEMQITYENKQISNEQLGSMINNINKTILDLKNLNIHDTNNNNEKNDGVVSLASINHNPEGASYKNIDLNDEISNIKHKITQNNLYTNSIENPTFSINQNSFKFPANPINTEDKENVSSKGIFFWYDTKINKTSQFKNHDFKIQADSSNNPGDNKLIDFQMNFPKISIKKDLLQGMDKIDNEKIQENPITSFDNNIKKISDKTDPLNNSNYDIEQPKSSKDFKMEYSLNQIGGVSEYKANELNYISGIDRGNSNENAMIKNTSNISDHNAFLQNNIYTNLNSDKNLFRYEHELNAKYISSSNVIPMRYDNFQMKNYSEAKNTNNEKIIIGNDQIYKENKLKNNTNNHFGELNHNNINESNYFNYSDSNHLIKENHENFIDIKENENQDYPENNQVNKFEYSIYNKIPFETENKNDEINNNYFNPPPPEMIFGAERENKILESITGNIAKSEKFDEENLMNIDKTNENQAETLEDKLNESLKKRIKNIEDALKTEISTIFKNNNLFESAVEEKMEFKKYQENTINQNDLRYTNNNYSNFSYSSNYLQSYPKNFTISKEYTINNPNNNTIINQQDNYSNYNHTYDVKDNNNMLKKNDNFFVKSDVKSIYCDDYGIKNNSLGELYKPFYHDQNIQKETKTIRVESLVSNLNSVCSEKKEDIYASGTYNYYYNKDLINKTNNNNISCSKFNNSSYSIYNKSLNEKIDENITNYNTQNITIIHNENNPNSQDDKKFKKSSTFQKPPIYSNKFMNNNSFVSNTNNLNSNYNRRTDSIQKNLNRQNNEENLIDNNGSINRIHHSNININYNNYTNYSVRKKTLDVNNSTKNSIVTNDLNIVNTVNSSENLKNVGFSNNLSEVNSIKTSTGNYLDVFATTIAKNIDGKNEYSTGINYNLNTSGNNNYYNPNLITNSGVHSNYNLSNEKKDYLNFNDLKSNLYKEQYFDLYKYNNINNELIYLSPNNIDSSKNESEKNQFSTFNYYHNLGYNRENSGKIAINNDINYSKGEENSNYGVHLKSENNQDNNNNHNNTSSTPTKIKESLIHNNSANKTDKFYLNNYINHTKNINPNFNSSNMNTHYNPNDLNNNFSNNGLSYTYYNNTPIFLNFNSIEKDKKKLNMNNLQTEQKTDFNITDQATVSSNPIWKKLDISNNPNVPNSNYYSNVAVIQDTNSNNQSPFSPPNYYNQNNISSNKESKYTFQGQNFCQNTQNTEKFNGYPQVTSYLNNSNFDNIKNPYLTFCEKNIINDTVNISNFNINQNVENIPKSQIIYNNTYNSKTIKNTNLINADNSYSLSNKNLNSNINLTSTNNSSNTNIDQKTTNKIILSDIMSKNVNNINVNSLTINTNVLEQPKYIQRIIASNKDPDSPISAVKNNDIQLNSNNCKLKNYHNCINSNSIENDNKYNKYLIQFQNHTDTKQVDYLQKNQNKTNCPSNKENIIINSNLNNYNINHLNNNSYNFPGNRGNALNPQYLIDEKLKVNINTNSISYADQNDKFYQKEVNFNNKLNDNLNNDPNNDHYYNRIKNLKTIDTLNPSYVKLNIEINDENHNKNTSNNFNNYIMSDMSGDVYLKSRNAYNKITPNIKNFSGFIENKNSSPITSTIIIKNPQVINNSSNVYQNIYNHPISKTSNEDYIKKPIVHEQYPINRFQTIETTSPKYVESTKINLSNLAQNSNYNHSNIIPPNKNENQFIKNKENNYYKDHSFIQNQSQNIFNTIQNGNLTNIISIPQDLNYSGAFSNKIENSKIIDSNNINFPNSNSSKTINSDKNYTNEMFNCQKYNYNGQSSFESSSALSNYINKNNQSLSTISKINNFNTFGEKEKNMNHDQQNHFNLIPINHSNNSTNLNYVNNMYKKTSGYESLNNEINSNKNTYEKMMSYSNFVRNVNKNVPGNTNKKYEYISLNKRVTDSNNTGK